MCFKHLLIIIFQLTVLQSVNGQNDLSSSEMHGIMDEIYNFNFETADSLIASIDSTTNPQLYNFYKSQYYRWTELPIHEKKGHILTKYYQYISLDLLPVTLLDTLVYFNNKLLKAEYYYNSGDIYPAFSQGLSLYNLVEPKLQLDNHAVQTEWLLPLSLYHYYYDYYKGTNSLLFSTMWLFEKGNKQKGLDGLKMLANSQAFGKTEALIYLTHIYLRLENKADSAFKYSLQLHQLYPENKKFFELLIESDLSFTNSNFESSALIEKLIESKSNYFTKYGLVYKALNEDMLNNKDQISGLKQTLHKVDSMGGGNHLKSLLYARLYNLSSEKDAKDQYGKLVRKHRQYNYNLTRID